MSYMLQFPPSPLPKNVTSPPYVLFGINDLDAFTDLPTNIPLTMVLHFAPALRKWIMPPPELSTAGIHLSLRTPYVGVNILEDMEVEGLGWIVARMMQIANIKNPPGTYDRYMTTPSLLVSIAVHKAWLALELPPAGIEALYMHIQTTLMIGPPVTLFDIRALWHNFPVHSPIQREMGLNFVRNYINRVYASSESSAIRHWYLETTERWSFFRELEKQTPAFGDVQKETMKAASERQKQEELYIQNLFKAEKDVIVSLEDERKERHEARRRERKEKRDREGRSSKRRLERARSGSTSSVETVIWHPSRSSSTEDDPTTPTTENSEPPLPHSQPIDSSALINMLEDVAIGDQIQSQPHMRNTVAHRRRLMLEVTATDKRKQEGRNAAAIAATGQIEDDNDFHETMEYIPPPDFSNPAKLKRKTRTKPVLKEKMSRPPSHGIYDTELEDTLASAPEVLSPDFEPGKKARGPLIYPDEDLHSEEKIALIRKCASYSPSAYHNEVSENVWPSHETIQETVSSVNAAIERGTSQQLAGNRATSEIRELDDDILEDANGLVYLQPAVYERMR
ncbi:uncharacterized protein N0V89_009426 [Didymosphaeria variabile]|uniref:Uncharacterized protein n=1 Tax=Didymosphaeria variabile TaxID=1932322 RepID=A0A9W8XF36_9PLEO|nr:uncharacterized protein N0V89_009426 [Didymosphaeria variabile]KAJ4348054.1 hypothetical protein N0V89_009426 [Didymosphaeria variabile]